MLEMELRSSQRMGSYSSNMNDRSFNSINKSSNNIWIPDYTLRAHTDLVYLKIRRSIYQMAVKANKLNSLNSESESCVREQDLVDTLTKVTKSDADHDINMSLRVTEAKSPEKFRSESRSALPELKMSQSFNRSIITSFRASMSRTSTQLSMPNPDLSGTSTPPMNESLFDSTGPRFLSPEKISSESKVVFMISDSDDQPDKTSLLHPEHKVS